MEEEAQERLQEEIHKGISTQEKTEIKRRRREWILKQQ